MFTLLYFITIYFKKLTAKQLKAGPSGGIPEKGMLSQR
jgi:hypothetical protein